MAGDTGDSFHLDSRGGFAASQTHHGARNSKMNSTEKTSVLRREPVVAFIRRPGAASALARVLLPEETRLDLPVLGSAALRFVGLDHEALVRILDEMRGAGESFPLPALGPGLLLVDPLLARHLTSRVLGLPMPPIVVALSRIERGVLGGLLAGAWGKLGLGGIDVAQAGATRLAADAVALEVSVDWAGETGRVWLCAAPASLGHCWAPPASSADAASAVRLELARTRLTTSDAQATAEGDVVVFEETSALSSSSSWSVLLRHGERCTKVSLDPKGCVRADDRTAVADRASPKRQAATSPGVEVTAELAHRAVGAATAAEAAFVLRPRGDGILLRADGRDWVEGSLCESDGRLAVRITRALAG